MTEFLLVGFFIVTILGMILQVYFSVTALRRTQELLIEVIEKLIDKSGETKVVNTVKKPNYPPENIGDLSYLRDHFIVTEIPKKVVNNARRRPK